jgi:two-component system sensor histidine kinase KdpD
MADPDAPAPSPRGGPLPAVRDVVARASRRGAPVALSLTLVLAATGLLVAVDASLAVATVCMVLVVVGASLLGYGSGLAAALSAFVCLTYFLTPPAGSFSIARADDLFALTAFVAVSLVVGVLLARLTRLRTRAERHAQEAELQVSILDRLIGSNDTDSILQDAAEEILRLFDLGYCEFTVASTRIGARSEQRVRDTISIESGPLRMDLGLGRPITSAEHSSVSALGMGLGAAIDRLRLQGELHDQSLAEAVARSRAAFLSAVTHDLRTPLATIKAAAAVLRIDGSSLDDVERKELVNTIYEDSSDLEQLVTKILDLTRIRAAGLQLELAPAYPVDLIAATVDRLRPHATGQLIDIDVEHDLPTVGVDALLLDHTLGNLLENGLRYAPPEQPLRVEARRNGSDIQFRIVDRGPGIHPDDRERIFVEFVRLDRHDRRGLGLGLPIARAIAAAHGGRIWCEETPGAGATFVLSLPIAEPEDVP